MTLTTTITLPFLPHPVWEKDRSPQASPGEKKTDHPQASPGEKRTDHPEPSRERKGQTTPSLSREKDRSPPSIPRREKDRPPQASPGETAVVLQSIISLKSTHNQKSQWDQMPSVCQALRTALNIPHLIESAQQSLRPSPLPR